MRLEEFATYGGNQGIWAPYYTLHKILAGLLAANTLTGNAQALDVATKIGDWAHSRLSKLRPEQFDRMWNMYIAGEYGGANDAFASLHAITRQAGVPHRRAVLRQPQREGPDGREQRHPRRPSRQPAHPAVHRLPPRLRGEQRARLSHGGEELLGHGRCRTGSTATAASASARSCASAT